jgi:hypothetical protein
MGSHRSTWGRGALIALAGAALAAPALLAQIGLSVDRDSLRAGETAVLTAAVATAGAQPVWEWSLAPGSAGSQEVDASGRARYLAPPFLLEPLFE